MNVKKETASAISFTQEQIDNRISDYVCWDCGLQFITDEQKKREEVVTAHKSICGLCNQHKLVTSIRNWNWLRLNSK